MSSRMSIRSCMCQGFVFICVSLAITGIIYQYAMNSAEKFTSASYAANQFSPTNYFKFANNSSTPLSSIRGRVTEILRDSSTDFEKLSSDVLDNIQQKITTYKKSSKSAHLNELLSTKDILLLSEKIEGFLKWVGGLSASEARDVLNWSRLANNEIHFMNILGKFLIRLRQKELEKNVYGFETIGEFARVGYQCLTTDQQQQQVISKSISMDICSEIEWYKLIQLCMPDASTFIDVGANKGYLGSLFVSLWGLNHYGIKPARIFEIATKNKLWESSRNPAGYCRDGYSHGTALHCPGERNRKTGDCIDAKPDKDIAVYSIDGSSYLTDALNTVISTSFANTAVKEKKIWRYFNFAMSDRQGVVQFTKQSKTNNPGFEGGRIRGTAESAQTEAVNMTTVDNFLEAMGIAELDVLKIDTEGNDNKVIVGASFAIRRHVKLFTFEGGSGVVLSKEMLQQFDDIGFSCYSTSRAGLFKWNSNCLPESMMGPFTAKDKGNVFCASRIRAPLVTLAMDALSFPLLIQQASIDPKKKFSADLAVLSAAFLNIKPYCKPWPACVVLA